MCILIKVYGGVYHEIHSLFYMRVTTVNFIAESLEKKVKSSVPEQNNKSNERNSDVSHHIVKSFWKFITFFHLFYPLNPYDGSS